MKRQRKIPLLLWIPNFLYIHVLTFYIYNISKTNNLLFWSNNKIDDVLFIFLFNLIKIKCLLYLFVFFDINTIVDLYCVNGFLRAISYWRWKPEIRSHWRWKPEMRSHCRWKPEIRSHWRWKPEIKSHWRWKPEIRSHWRWKPEIRSHWRWKPEMRSHCRWKPEIRSHWRWKPEMRSHWRWKPEMRSPFLAIHMNDSMFMDDFVKWFHYNVILENINVIILSCVKSKGKIGSCQETFYSSLIVQSYARQLNI